MSLPRFFLDEQVLAAETEAEFLLRLSGEDAKHAKVLRLKAGEHLAVIDADNDYFECEIAAFEGNLPLVRIAQHAEVAPRPAVCLCQGLAKADKMETVIRHCTELGVSSFQPLACGRSVMKLDDKKAARKIDRWASIVKSAAMQSGQPSLAQVNEPLSIKASLPLLAEASCVLIAWEEAPQTCSIRSALSCLDGIPVKDQRIVVIVGPEGGLSAEEVELLLGSNPEAHLITLGPSILRTETAGLVASALVLYELGCMGDR